MGEDSEMNKPVAWIDPKELDMAVSTTVTKNKQFDSDIPLYTHPVKELTDEEITDVFVECLLPDGEFDEHEFAKAILRKAQEK